MRHLAAFAASALLAIAAVPREARACGGCFIPPSESTVVTGHRMALSISPTQAVLWDQIQYAGDPAEFSWVLPVKPGAFVEVASDAFFDVLEAGTQTLVQAPPEGCRSPGGGSGFGCSASEAALSDGSAGAQNGGVEIVHHGTVGPYETVTLSASDPNALTNWLDENGYELPPSVAPTVASYVNEGFDFIALKLQPGKDVKQMKPVRVITSGAGYTLPLRMVAAGAGANVDLVLFVIGEGRYQAGNFENGRVPPNLVTWNFRDDSSDYGILRLEALAAHGGRTWLTSYARRDPFLSPIFDALGQVSYLVDPVDFTQASQLADAYFLQGAKNGEIPSAAGCSAATQHAGSMKVEPSGADEIAASDFACGDLDDLAVAFTGLHPADVFLTRLEARLPVELLDVDLTLQAADEQQEIAHRFAAGLKVNACWDSEPAAAGLFVPTPGSPRIPPGALVALVLGAAGVSLALRRRAVAIG
jgi:hypothetical protein